jgi:hypothetical protein
MHLLFCALRSRVCGRPGRVFGCLALTGFFQISGFALTPKDGIPIDFSTAGYAGGGVAIPTVPARYRVESSSGGDDTAAIQAALDAAGKLRTDAEGFRGAVVLGPGVFHIAGQLKIQASGVVLRGDGSTLVATGHSRRTLIEVWGLDDRVLGPGSVVMGDRVPPGTSVLKVESVDGFKANARVVVLRPSTQKWIGDLNMDKFTGTFKSTRLDWRPGSRDIEWERTVIAVDPTNHTLTLDAPITTALETRYGGGTVHTLSWPGRLSRVGVENLICMSEFASPIDEEHSWICVSLDRVENAWVRNVTARHFVGTAVWVGAQARATTVQDCVSELPVSSIAGWRRVSFFVGGQQVLMQRCTADDGRCDFVAGYCAAGPDVFLDCRATHSFGDSGGFESWASGILYDDVDIGGAALGLKNLGEARQGAGWTMANSVAWNCFATGGVTADDPPGAFNLAVSNYEDRSLYCTQLYARRGSAGLNALASVALSGDRLSDVPAAPLATPAVVPAVEPLAIIGGRFTAGNRAVFGGTVESAMWTGQLIPELAQKSKPSPIRWAPGRVGPGLTEDLDELTHRMELQGNSVFLMIPGLWYDRRRDSHFRGPWADSDVWAPFLEMPWARSGEGLAWDGLSKWDLTKFNPWYWDRVNELARLCEEKGLFVINHFYQNHNIQEDSAHYADFPWDEFNCIQKTGIPDLLPRHDPGLSNTQVTLPFDPRMAEKFYDVTNLEHRKLHRLLFFHGFDVLADNPNVIHTLGAEFAGPLEFQQFFLDMAAEWQQEHHQRLHLALITSKAVTDAILADPVRAPLVDVIDMQYWQYLPDGRLFAPDGQGKKAFRQLRTEYFGTYDGPVPHGTPELVYRQVREYRDRFPDKAIVCGDAGVGPIPVLMAGGAAAHIEYRDEPVGAVRSGTAFIRFVNEQLAEVLSQMNPRDGITSDGTWCLADQGQTWLFCSLRGDAIRLTRSIAAAAGVTGLWFNPRNGEVSAATLSGGAVIAKPTGEAWVLLLKAKKTDPATASAKAAPLPNLVWHDVTAIGIDRV